MGTYSNGLTKASVMSTHKDAFLFRGITLSHNYQIIGAFATKSDCIVEFYCHFNDNALHTVVSTWFSFYW